MKFDSISSSPLPLPLLFLLGIYSLSGLCLLNVNAEVSVQSCPPEIRQTHSLAARAEHDDDDDDDSDDTASPVDSVETVSNHGEPWTDEEDERLIKLREEQRSWTEVAKSFPERTGIALKSRYHRLKKDPSKTSETNKPWNDEEDRKLLDLVETEASWEERALYLPGRSAHAARVRYRYLKRGDSLPKKFRRKFTAKEDELLLQLDEAGIPWKERVAYFKNRPLHSLRYRIRKLKPSKREGPRKFTSKEDDELIEAVRLGMTVEEICELLERNQKAVRRRIFDIRTVKPA